MESIKLKREPIPDELKKWPHIAALLLCALLYRNN